MELKIKQVIGEIAANGKINKQINELCRLF